MKRREFLMLIGGAAAWPLGAQAQHLPTIGLLSSGSREVNELLVAAFHQGLREAGFMESQNVAIEYRWAGGLYQQLSALAGELVDRHVDVLVTLENTATAKAAKAATSTIPIVFSIGTDPVKFGLVDSLNRPGSNATGIVLLTVGRRQAAGGDA
jgi:putative ABC transport system substrate-binding protein